MYRSFALCRFTHKCSRCAGRTVQMSVLARHHSIIGGPALLFHHILSANRRYAELYWTPPLTDSVSPFSSVIIFPFGIVSISVLVCQLNLVFESVYFVQPLFAGSPHTSLPPPGFFLPHLPCLFIFRHCPPCYPCFKSALSNPMLLLASWSVIQTRT